MITNQPLYQLSYIGTPAIPPANGIIPEDAGNVNRFLITKNGTIYQFYGHLPPIMHLFREAGELADRDFPAAVQHGAASEAAKHLMLIRADDP